MPKGRSMKKQRGCAMKGGLSKINGGGDASGSFPGNLSGNPMRGGDCSAKPIMGGDASTHAERVYGAAGHQSAGQGNLIAMRGGYRHRRNKSKSRGGSKKRGGTAIMDMAVPAALLYGQQKYASRSRKNKSAKNRFTRRH